MLQAGDPHEAIRLKATRLMVVRDGKVIARTPERVTSLNLAERAPQLTLEFRPGSIS
jgi:cytosine deaminase